MDAQGHDFLKSVGEVPDLYAAAHGNLDFATGVTVVGCVVGRSGEELFLALEDGTTFAIPFDGIVGNLTPIDEPNHSLPGLAVAVRLKRGSRVTSAKVLEVGKDITEPEHNSRETLACPPQCTSPVQCGVGCCCDGKKCQGRSCV